MSDEKELNHPLLRRPAAYEAQASAEVCLLCCSDRRVCQGPRERTEHRATEALTTKEWEDRRMISLPILRSVSILPLSRSPSVPQRHDLSGELSAAN